MATKIKRETFIKKVAAVLQTSYPGASVDLVPCDDGRVTGEIAWAGFNPNDGYADQVKLSKVLQSKLGTNADRVIMLFTLTPLQKKVLDEDRLAEEEDILATAKRITHDRRKKSRLSASNGRNGHNATATKKRKLTAHG